MSEFPRRGHTGPIDRKQKSSWLRYAERTIAEADRSERSKQMFLLSRIKDEQLREEADFVWRGRDYETLGEYVKALREIWACTPDVEEVKKQLAQLRNEALSWEDFQSKFLTLVGEIPDTEDNWLKIKADFFACLPGSIATTLESEDVLDGYPDRASSMPVLITRAQKLFRSAMSRGGSKTTGGPKAVTAATGTVNTATVAGSGQELNAMGTGANPSFGFRGRGTFGRGRGRGRGRGGNWFGRGTPGTPTPQGPGNVGNGSNSNTGSEWRTCHRCKTPGHLMKDCPQLQQGALRPAKANGLCYNCGKPGHLARDCTNPKTQE